ncbi:MAG TPA: DUF4261 domain-containing protein [Burkholderiaceae bacterium]|nr:DUF4261 domain-containing protein [Burkholderiaceae bacterium]
MRSFLTAFLFFFTACVAAAAETAEPRVSSIVLLAQPRLPEAQAFRAQLEGRLKGRLRIDAMEADGPAVLLRVRGGKVLVGLIDAPLPKGQIQDLCQGAWYWRRACEDTDAHRAHVFVSTVGTDLDRLDAYLLQTDVVAALMDPNAIASYWGASLQPRDAFLKQSAAAARATPPVWLWTNFRISNDREKGFSLSTQGMEQFGLREIEAKDVKRGGLEVFMLLMGTAQYLVSEGPVIQDGDTIGASPALGIRVHQGPSYWRQGATVYRISYPTE